MADRIERPMGRARPTRSAHRPRRAWGLGVLVGLVFGLGSLVGGAIAFVLGVAAAAVLAVEPPRAARLGGAALGFGAAWLVLVGSAGLRCGSGCSGPDVGPWLMAGSVVLLVGVVLSTLAIRSAPMSQLD